MLLPEALFVLRCRPGCAPSVAGGKQPPGPALWLAVGAVEPAPLLTQPSQLPCTGHTTTHAFGEEATGNLKGRPAKPAGPGREVGPIHNPDLPVKPSLVTACEGEPPSL